MKDSDIETNETSEIPKESETSAAFAEKLNEDAPLKAEFGNDAAQSETPKSFAENLKNDGLLNSDEVEASDTIIGAEGTNDSSGMEAADTIVSPDVESKAAQDWEGERWNAPDGTRHHTDTENMLADEFNAELVNGQEVYVTPEIGVEIGKDAEGQPEIGRVDLQVDVGDEQKLIDIKTNDMSQWTEADATREGEAAGLQVSEYMNSPDTKDDAQGYVWAQGKEPSEEAKTAYEEAAAKYGVEVVWHEGNGSPEAIKQEFEDKYLQNTEDSRPKANEDDYD